ncbi:MAG: GNAT family N-acetyltransferase [Acidimicrobiales bacterium]
MSLKLREEPLGLLNEHARVSIAFAVDRTLAVSLRSDGLGGILLDERLVGTPYVKDHDGEGEDPTHWPQRFGTSRWGLIAAHDGDRRVGGAVIAFQSAEVWMLEGRADLAALWDLRVSPEVRNMGVGSQLFHAVEDWARARDCRQLKIETQNINVPASHFYRRMGCTLGGINRFAYPARPHEAQLLWFKDL